jgi:PKD repeat protein
VASGSTVTHTFTESGRYDVSLTVMDDDGRSASALKPIIVNLELKGISLNFYRSDVADGPLNPADIAGAVPLANWNNADRSNTGAQFSGFSGAVDSDGVATAVTFDWPDDGRNIYATAGIDPILSPDHNMLASYYGEIGSFYEEIVISGIPQDFQDQWYDIYVYWGGKTSDWASGGCIEIGVLETGESYFLTDLFSGWNGTHLQSSATTCGTATDGPTYVRLQALDLQTVTLTINSSSGQRMGVSGIQIVYNPGIPLPDAQVLTANPFTGLPVSFDASGSVDNGTILSYEWDFGDGATGSGISPAHAYANPGTYPVTLTVTDDFGLSASTSTQVTVNPQNGGRSISVNFGESIYFISTSDLVGVVPRYNWNNAIGGTVADLADEAGHLTGASLTGSPTNYRTLVDPNSAEKRMMKSHSGVMSGTYTVNVTGIPADISANGYDVYIYLGGGRDGDEGQATYTIGTDSLVVKYNFGQAWDGSHTRSFATSSAVAIAGNDYVVFENVTDTDLVITVDVPSNNRTGISGLQIVANATQADFSASVLSGYLPLSVDFDASGSSGGGELDYAWNFGDGSTGVGATANHLFTAPGVYEVVLTATASGTGAGTDSVTIEVFDSTVTPPDLTVIASATSGTAPEFIFFDATATSGDEPISVIWNFGDGNSATGATAGNTFLENGYYRVQVEARNAGGVDRKTIEILIVQPNIAAPVATFTVDTQTGPAPLLVELNASATTGPNVETRFFWDFGDGSTGEGMIVQHTYTDQGSYTVTLHASNAGGVDIAAALIEVDDAVPPEAVAVSINFGDRFLDTAEIAGVEPRAFWNNLNTTATVADLLDSDGAPTSVSVMCDAGNKYTTEDTVFETGDQKMMGSIRGTLAGSFTVNIAGIPGAYQASGYDVIVYFGGKDSSTYVGEYIIDGQARYIRDNIGTWDGTHRESTATSAATAAVGDNFVRWNGLQAGSFSMLVNRAGAQRYGISGMQIVKKSSLPPLTPGQKRAWMERDPDEWVIAIPSVAGYEYALRMETTLGTDPDVWIPVGFPVSGDGSVLEFRVSKASYPADPMRFFIIVITEE